LKPKESKKLFIIETLP